MVPRDTDAAAHEAQMAAFRRMTPQERVRLAVEMTEDANRIALDGIHHRHPDYSDLQLKRALFRLLHGDATVQAMWPDQPLVAP